MEIIFLQNILGRGGDIKQAKRRATNVESFLNKKGEKECDLEGGDVTVLTHARKESALRGKKGERK